MRFRMPAYDGCVKSGKNDHSRDDDVIVGQRQRRRSRRCVALTNMASSLTVISFRNGDEVAIALRRRIREAPARVWLTWYDHECTRVATLVPRDTHATTRVTDVDVVCADGNDVWRTAIRAAPTMVNDDGVEQPVALRGLLVRACATSSPLVRRCFLVLEVIGGSAADVRSTDAARLLARRTAPAVPPTSPFDEHLPLDHLVFLPSMDARHVAAFTCAPPACVTRHFAPRAVLVRDVDDAAARWYTGSIECLL